jgi:hypothetical protein
MVWISVPTGDRIVENTVLAINSAVEGLRAVH